MSLLVLILLSSHCYSRLKYSKPVQSLINKKTRKTELCFSCEILLQSKPGDSWRSISAHTEDHTKRTKLQSTGWGRCWEYCRTSHPSDKCMSTVTESGQGGQCMYSALRVFGCHQCVYCTTGFIRPCFNFAQLTVGEFKTRANKHSHIECIVYIVTVWIKNRLIQKFFMSGRIFCILQYSAYNATCCHQCVIVIHTLSELSTSLCMYNIIISLSRL